MEKGTRSVLKKLPVGLASLSTMACRRRGCTCSLQTQQLRKSPAFFLRNLMRHLSDEKEATSVFYSYTRPQTPCRMSIPENTHFLQVETAQPACQALLLQLQEDGDPAKLGNGAICVDSTYVSMRA